MSVILKLATSLNRRDELPNIELARKIVKAKDGKAVKELVEHLRDKSVGIQNDCIKTLYEAGELAPEMISEYADEFISLLQSRNNRMQWGAMMAIFTITPVAHKKVFESLPEIIAAADKGSVITKDNAVKILVALSVHKKYSPDTIPLLLEQLLKSPVNQFPMYAELTLPVINPAIKQRFIHILNKRLSAMEEGPKKKRVIKVIRKADEAE